MPCILSPSIIGAFSGDTGAAVELISPCPSLTKGQGSPSLGRAALGDPEPVSGCASSPPGPAAGPLSWDPAHRQGHPG